jgi:aminopeptidase N
LFIWVLFLLYFAIMNLRLKTLFVLMALPFFGLAQEEECKDICRRNSLGQARTLYPQSPLMNKYDLKYLKLDVSLETTNTNISGSAFYKMKAIQSVSEIAIEFKDNMTVTSVQVNGVSLPFNRLDNHIYVPLSTPFAPGTLFNVEYFYNGLATGDSYGTGLGRSTDPSTGLSMTASLSESFHAYEWFPAKQILTDKIDSVDMWITTSAINKVGSQGLLQNVTTLAGGKVRYEWKCRYPMNYYMPSVAVGKYIEYRNYAKPTAMLGDSILMQYYIGDANNYLNTIKPSLDRIPSHVEKFSDLVGLYPFSREKYGLSHANIGGGEEHQTMTTQSSFGTSLSAHELFHQWFGDNVTCARWNDIFINEGFATYGELISVENFPQYYTSTTVASLVNGWHNSVMGQPGGSIYIPDAELNAPNGENRIFSSRLSYNKGGAFLWNLRFEIGSDFTFYNILKNFQQQYKDSVATGDDLRVLIDNTTGRSFQQFFDQWYYGQGFPTYNVDYTKNANQLYLTIGQTTSVPAATPIFKGFLQVTLQTTTGDTLVKLNVQNNPQTFTFTTDRIVNGIVVDPNNYIMNRVGNITTAVNNIAALENSVKVSPNPAYAKTTVSFKANDFTEMQLIDLSGKVLWQNSIATNATSAIVNLPIVSGIFLIRMNGKKGTIAKRVMVK